MNEKAYMITTQREFDADGNLKTIRKIRYDGKLNWFRRLLLELAGFGIVEVDNFDRTK